MSQSRKPREGSSYCSVSTPLFKEWSINVLSLVEKSFGRQSVHFEGFSEHCNKFGGWETEFEDCRAIFKAAREDYEGGYLFGIRALVKAEVLSDAFQQARELLENGYKDPACILCRVALEIALKELCDRKALPHGKLDKMNSDLCKAGIYNMTKQKQITAWAEIGNKAAHGHWDQYTMSDIQSMLAGVESLVADIL